MGILDFTKSQGLGNDFIVIDNTGVNIDMPPNAIKALCDRHYGVGADGLILVEPSTVADYFMNYFNADGSAAEMCGNGIRVCAKYIYQHIEPRDTMRIETRAGVRAVELTVSANLNATDKIHFVLETMNLYQQNGDQTFTKVA